MTQVLHEKSKNQQKYTNMKRVFDLQKLSIKNNCTSLKHRIMTITNALTIRYLR